MAAPMQTEMMPQKQPELTIASLCQIGQDIVQELVQKVTEVFLNLKHMQLPTGTQPSMRNSQVISSKLRDGMAQIERSFQKLHYVYNECSKKLPDDVDPLILVPFTDFSKTDMMGGTEPPLQKSAKIMNLEQRKHELESVLRSKNQQLEMLVRQMRNLVWEVNTIIAFHDGTIS